MRTILNILFVLFIVIPSQGQVVNRGGENRDGHYNEENLLKVWPEEGPELFLAVEGIGKGFSSAIVSNNTIYITGKKDSFPTFIRIIKTKKL